MKAMNKVLVLGLVLAVTGRAWAGSATRDEVSLSDQPWRVWLDTQAAWQQDELYAPGETPALATLPVHPPTGGWEALNDSQGKACALPASVEEYFSGGTNTWNYHGVSWFWCDVKVPSAWQGKVVRLAVEKARMRAEIYVNGRLAGYDLVAETPFAADLSAFLQYGARNRIAIRLTNPGGQRGWEDSPRIGWGKALLPASHDFSGLGRLSLAACEPIYVDDVFVKNLLPAGARNIEVQAFLLNTTAATADCTVEVSIPGTRAKARQNVVVPPGRQRVVFPFTVPEAKLWDPQHPQLYPCTVSLKNAVTKTGDRLAVRFGFRVFELKPGASGGHNFYLNGQRFRLKSAIDWGYYALTGFYATPEMARKSVEAARALTQTGINFHRRIGEPLVMDYADELGLCIYEEPGAFHDIPPGSLEGKIMAEKCRRMATRDRNHPSLITINLSNEDNHWDALREQVLRELAALDGSRLVLNTSGAEFTNRAEDRGGIRHIRPYESDTRLDFLDYHNACNIGARFNEGAVFVGTHRHPFEDRAYYPGEVISTTGPGNWYLCAEMGRTLKPARPGYDLNIQTGNHDKLAAAFRDWNMAKAGGGLVRSPADLSTLAASGQMYMMGRHAQSVMANNTAEGYALNGWSSGPQSTGTGSDWDSALCDEGRNLKGRPEYFLWWIRPAQIALFRKNGKYFKPGDKASLEVNLINEGVIAPGDAQLTLQVTDGAGQATALREERNIKIIGGDCFAQSLEPFTVPLEPGWHGGYITVNATLRRGAQVLAAGAEQLLLANRSSYRDDLAPVAACGAVCQWPAAREALQEAGVTPADFTPTLSAGKLRFIAAGAVPDDATLAAMLNRVKRDGTLLLVKFDAAWAKALLAKGLLSQPVTEWGGHQADGWDGNGWGYLERFLGDQTIPGKTVAGTTGWEVPGDPVGFYPFASEYPLNAYGLYMARPRKFPHTLNDPDAERRTLLVLVGTIRYGKGRILLAPSYPVDAKHPFNDLLFYRMLIDG